MASTLQSAAARINGAQSQGPVTPAGKAVSSQNSLRHGMCSKQVVLPGEDPQEFARHRATYLQQYRPLTQPETDQVEIIANTCWRLKRMMAFEAALLSGEETDPLKALGLLIRYENQLNRTREQAVKMLKDQQENRPCTARPIQRNEPEQSSEVGEQDLESVIQAAMTIPTAPFKPETLTPAVKKSAA